MTNIETITVQATTETYDPTDWDEYEPRPTVKARLMGPDTNIGGVDFSNTMAVVLPDGTPAPMPAALFAAFFQLKS